MTEKVGAPASCTAGRAALECRPSRLGLSFRQTFVERRFDKQFAAKIWAQPITADLLIQVFRPNLLYLLVKNIQPM
jgi:hypothetical protein